MQFRIRQLASSHNITQVNDRGAVRFSAVHASPRSHIVFVTMPFLPTVCRGTVVITANGVFPATSKAWSRVTLLSKSAKSSAIREGFATGHFVASAPQPPHLLVHLLVRGMGIHRRRERRDVPRDPAARGMRPAGPGSRNRAWLNLTHAARWEGGSVPPAPPQDMTPSCRSMVAMSK